MLKLVFEIGSRWSRQFSLATTAASFTETSRMKIFWSISRLWSSSSSTLDQELSSRKGLTESLTVSNVNFLHFAKCRPLPFPRIEVSISENHFLSKIGKNLFALQLPTMLRNFVIQGNTLLWSI